MEHAHARVRRGVGPDLAHVVRLATGGGLSAHAGCRALEPAQVVIVRGITSETKVRKTAVAPARIAAALVKTVADGMRTADVLGAVGVRADGAARSATPRQDHGAAGLCAIEPQLLH